MWPSTSNPVVASYDDDDSRIKLVDYLQVGRMGRIHSISSYNILSYLNYHMV